MSSVSSKPHSFFVWTIASLFYAYQYMVRLMPSVMMPEFMEHFQIDSVLFGQLSGMYYIGYSLAHIPLGLLLDRFGPKQVLPVCILLVVLGMSPFLLADTWVYPILGRFLIGVGSSAAILGAFKIIHLMFTQDRFTRMLSFSVTIGLMGAIYGGGPMNWMKQSLGYQTVIGFLMMVGLGLALATYIFIPSYTSSQKPSIMSDLKSVLQNKRVIQVCLFAGLMVGPLEGFADAWGPPFLRRVLGLESNLSASLLSAIFIGMCVGGPILSYIAEKTKGYYDVIISVGVIMSVSFFWFTWHAIDPFPLGILFFVVGLGCAYQIIAIFKASQYVPEHVVGLTTAVANMIIMVFGYIFHSLIGLIVQKLGGSEDVFALKMGISIIPLGIVLAVIGFISIVIKEKPSLSSLKA